MTKKIITWENPNFTTLHKKAKSYILTYAIVQNVDSFREISEQIAAEYLGLA